MISLAKMKNHVTAGVTLAIKKHVRHHAQRNLR